MVDPPCAPMEEINAWLGDKKSMMLMLQYKPDFVGMALR